jgi:hypothetical protein
MDQYAYSTRASQRSVVATQLPCCYRASSRARLSGG